MGMNYLLCKCAVAGCGLQMEVPFDKFFAVDPYKCEGCEGTVFEIVGSGVVNTALPTGAVGSKGGDNFCHALHPSGRLEHKVDGTWFDCPGSAACPVCTMNCYADTNYEHHEGSIYPYQCRQCGDGFASRGEFESHKGTQLAPVKGVDSCSTPTL